MPATPRILLTLTLGVAAYLAMPAAVGADTPPDPDPDCGGVVFRDADADGRRVEILEHDNLPDDLEDGVGGIDVLVTDVYGSTHESRTSGSGTWSVELRRTDYPIRIEFDVPADHVAGPPGPDSGPTVQFAAAPGACDGSPVGNVGIYRTGGFCASQPEIAVPCYVKAGHPTYDELPAIHAVSNATIDDANTSASTIDDWLRPDARVVATNGDIGTVYGQASKRDGTLFASAFTKRHTLLRSSLNPSGNPTAIFRIPPDGEPELFTLTDRFSSDPHDVDDEEDLASMDAVFTSGIGDIEISPDESTLYAVDLGRRELVALDADTGGLLKRYRLDGERLGRSDCNVGDGDPFGDLRAFGLGWRDDTLLVGVVCSAASTVDPDRAVREQGAPGSGGGNHGQLRGYVFGVDDGEFTLLLDWALDGHRGETQGNGLRSNDAAWHPWVPAYPFDAEHEAVSYPQPAITDLVVDRRGDLVIALGDRWSHQTGPETTVPAWDGGTRSIIESISAGDLQRACLRNRGWVIEGSLGCEGGIGNGWEFFGGESYGWHAETALGSVARLPGRAEVVATQMNPKPEDDTWWSGGLAWHTTDDGEYAHGARLYDGRSVEPTYSFRHTSGLGDLAILCGGPSRSLGGAVWHDRDANGVRDPGDSPVADVVLELSDPDGEILSIDITDERGRYAFDADNVPSGLVDGVDYSVTLADRNHDPTQGVLAGFGAATGLVPTYANVGARTDLDSDAVQRGLPASRRSGFVHRFGPGAAIDHTRDIGLRDRYDLSVTTSPGPRMRDEGVVAFRLDVRNEGSLPSGAFSVTASLPAETSMRSAGVATSVATSLDADGVTWAFADAQSIAPGDVRSIDMVLQVNDPTITSITNRVQIVGDSGLDEDSTPRRVLDEDDEDEMTVELFGLTGTVWIDVAGDESGRIERGAAGVVVHVLDDADRRVGGTTTDDSGRFLFEAFPAGTYRIAVPASEFGEDGPLRGYDRAIGAGSGDVGDMLDESGVVGSEPIALGRDIEPGDSVEVRMGLVREPGRPLLDVVVPAVLLPISLLCVTWLFLDRRRLMGASLLPSRGN